MIDIAMNKLDFNSRLLCEKAGKVESDSFANTGDSLSHLRKNGVRTIV